MSFELPRISDFSTVRTGDMPGDKVEIGDQHDAKARTIFPVLWGLLQSVLERSEYHRAVVSVHGGSGVGKSEIGSLLAHYLNLNDVGAYVMSGDNYPRRIPAHNDAERLRVFDAGGRDALQDYLGSDSETNFDEVNEIMARFHAGEPTISLKRMGREPGELCHESVDFSDVSVLVIEWTHGNNDRLVGVDIPILLNSTPEETLAHRRSRARDGGVDSPFTTMVLRLEQQLLASQAHRAKIIVAKSGEIISYEALQNRA